MTLEAIFTVTLGLFLTWMVLSVSIKIISDYLNIISLLPARYLQDTIISMLHEDYELLRKFYNHNAIQNLSPRIKKQTDVPAWFSRYPITRGFAATTIRIPNKIPSHVFAKAMFDVFIYESLSLEEAKGELTTARMQTSIERLRSYKPQLSQILTDLFPRLDRPAILESKIAECRTNIENWYKDLIVDLEERQQRYEQVIALSLGLIIVFLFNIDMISIAKYLWREPAVRQVLVAQASTFQPSEIQSGMTAQATVEQFTEQFVGLNLTVGWDLKKYTAMAVYNSDCQLFPRPGQFFGIPIFLSNFCTTQPHSTDSTNITVKLFGLLITAGAAAQGAPFWSEMLKKLVNPPGTGPNKSEKGASK